MPLYPHRLPGESRPGQPLPPHPSDRPKQDPKPEQPAGPAPETEGES